MTPFEQLGGEAVVRRIAEAFYRHMDESEPALAKLHRLDDAGKVHPEARERFALFFVGWLGGPQTYMERHGHPRLRMRHGAVPIDEAMRDAWIRAMVKALDECQIDGDSRVFLEQKLREVANFLRNT
jgi:hemoglobin